LDHVLKGLFASFGESLEKSDEQIEE